MKASTFFVGPHKTPKNVKLLIITTILISLLSPIITYFFENYWNLPGPSAWLSLSLFGLKQRWLWQPITYFFLHSAGIGISFSLLLSLFFHMFLLWFSGSEITFRFGNRGFLFFYLGAGLFAGIISALFLLISSSQTVLIGSGPPIYALMIVWAMIYPDLELFFFFILRIKAKWLVALYLTFALLVDLSYGAFILFLADLAGIIWGILIGNLIWKLPNPYPLNLEFSHRKRTKKNKESKIIDISVFQENDDIFMDRMLDKIVKKGKDALTKKEHERMKKISEKKRADHK